MGLEHDGRERRDVRVQTPRGAIEGSLLTGPTIRTLDDLNQGSRPFLELHGSRALSVDWLLDPAPLAISKSTVLFVVERSPARPTRSPATVDTTRFGRSALRLWVGEHSIEGFLHVPLGGKALMRLNHATHAFIAMTSVSVVGPDAEFAAPFLAVNRLHVLAAQELVAAELAEPAPA